MIPGTPFHSSPRKLTHAETRYRPFDRKLLAMYLAIKHILNILECRLFHALTNHKPLTLALNTQSNCHSICEARHLNYILQFTSTVHFVHGLDNVVADALTYIETNGILSGQPPIVHFAAMARTQVTESQIHSLQSFPSSTVVMEAVPLANSSNSLYSDTSIATQ